MKLQNYIKENIITESINDKGIMKICFMAGSPGAGKTYTLGKISDGSIMPRIVNVDKWVEYFHAGYDTETFTKPKMITKNEVFNYVNSLLPIVNDATSTDTHVVVNRRNIIERLGYDTACIYIETPLEVALARVEARNKEGKRFVPLDFAREYHAKSQNIRRFLSHAFKVYMEIKNGEGELTDEVIIKAYNRMSFFYTSPLQNKIGKDILQVMRENGWKYLTDGIYTPQELEVKIHNWYRS